MVLRVKPPLTRFPTNSFYTPMDNTPLHSISSVATRAMTAAVFCLNLNPLNAHYSKMVV